MRDLGGKVAVVTGGGSGIGRSLARAFAAAGCSVAVADVDSERASAVAEEVGGAGFACDVADPAAVERLAGEVVASLGGVHVLCNNAGVALSGTSWETPLEEWHRLMDVNLWGVVHGIRTFVPRFIAQGEGHVVNTASLAGLTIAPGLAAYGVSKHAVVALSELLARDLEASGATGVGVTALCPGFVRTSLMEDPRSYTAATDVGRMIGQALVGGVEAGLDPDDVAEAVVDAVRHGRPFVLTEPTTKDQVRARAQTVLDAPL